MSDYTKTWWMQQAEKDRRQREADKRRVSADMAAELLRENTELKAALRAAEERVKELETLRVRVHTNAVSWHGPEGLGTGHARALAVIAEWCAALATDQENEE